MMLQGTSQVSVPAVVTIGGIGGSDGAPGEGLPGAVRMQDGLLLRRRPDVESIGR